ncbi:MAG: mechanosensitive ion channel [Chloroflexi bacterium]|nr:mechanosensitive ion channel [Chloroflexota bacterium]
MSWDQLFLLPLGWLPELGGRLAVAVVVFIAAWLLGRVLRRWARGAAVRMRVDANIRFLAGELLYWFVLALGILLVLTLFRVDPSVILATFGAAGLALGLAAQDILKGFFAGIYLLFERPFLIGDEIEIKDHVGRVEHVGFRATIIRTADNVRIVVPNAMIFGEIVSNRTERQGDGSG